MKMNEKAKIREKKIGVEKERLELESLSARYLFLSQKEELPQAYREECQLKNRTLCLMNLINSIIEKAFIDYQAILKRENENNPNKNDLKDKKDLEYFFRNDCKSYADIIGTNIPFFR